jgi:uncharacterized membrane protein YjgN (DUF898 family)
MDAMTSPAAAEESRAVHFSGTMREFLPIALTNALLTVVTLFIYRSWATARERRYLWSRSRFVDDELQWTGTGKEMFVGFVLVALSLGAIGLAVAFVIPALATRSGPLAVVAAVIAFYIGGLFLYGVARFRALRYRLSRTWWRGIRGGSNDPGWTYGRKAIGYYLASFVVAGLLYPWAQARLWNERWRKMSFGPHQFEADMTWEDTRGAFFGLWGTGVAGGLMLAVVAGPPDELGNPSDPGVLATLLFYGAIALAYLNYVTAYYRAAAGSTRIGNVEFRLHADFKDWLKFYATTLGLAVITLGLAMLVYNFRKWRFITSHLEAYGEIDVDALTQSQTTTPREAEGFLEALDIGAF